MAKRTLNTLAIIILLVSPFRSLAWGATGHRIIAEIAFKYLDDQTKKNVLALLNGMSPEEASVWMDEVRGDRTYDYMRPYHYADFERGKPATNIPGDNIIGVINATLRDLNNTNQLSTQQTRTDLLYFMHLVGDIHQPLHIGYADDRGGNDYQVSFMGNGSNLHKVWDSEIIEYKRISLQEVIAANPLSPEQIKDIQKIDIVSWANQSRGYLNMVYAVQGHQVDEAYIAKVYPVIEKQLFNAGIRLAEILELYFGNISVVPKPSAVLPSATITASEASGHVGETRTVCGKVFGGKYLENSNGAPTLINMGADYPDNPFTLVIYGSDRGSFSYKPEEWLPGKTICVTGLIKLFKGKPEIVVTKESQIQIK